jgi:hypothetical protein
MARWPADIFEPEATLARQRDLIDGAALRLGLGLRFWRVIDGRGLGNASDIWRCDFALELDLQRDGGCVRLHGTSGDVLGLGLAVEASFGGVAPLLEAEGADAAGRGGGLSSTNMKPTGTSSFGAGRPALSFAQSSCAESRLFLLASASLDALSASSGSPVAAAWSLRYRDHAN